MSTTPFRSNHVSCFWLLVLISAAAALAVSGWAATVTWDADTVTTGAQDGAGIWDPSANNWWDGSADNGWNNGDSAIFGTATAAAGTVTITNSGITVSNITFNAAGSGNYTINTTNGSTLTLVGSPALTANADATIALILAGTGFTKNGTARLNLAPGANNNTFNGATVVNAGTLAMTTGTDGILQFSSTNLTINAGSAVLYTTAGVFPSTGSIYVNGGLLTNGNPTGGKLLQLSRLIMDNNAIVNAAFSQASMNLTNIDARSGLLAIPRFNAVATTNYTVKSTPGMVELQGGANNAGSQGIGFLTLNAGTLFLNYLNPGPNGDSAIRGRVINTGSFTIGGGGVLVSYPPGTGGRTENTGSTTVNPGATSFVISNNNVSGGYLLNLAAVTRNTGGTIDFSRTTLGGGAGLASSSTNANGILGGWATFAGNDWMVANGASSVSAYAGYQTNNDPTQWGSVSNVSLNVNPSANLDDTTIYSLRLSNGPSVIINSSKTLTLSSGGLLVAGAGATALTGGALRIAAGADLVVQQYSTADLTIGSGIADNAGTSLTKSGPGKLILTGGNTMTGANFLNRGIVEVNDLAKLAAGGLVMNNGTLRYTGSDASSSRAVILNGAGGSFDIVSGTKLTQTTAINGSGGVNSPFGGFNMGDWGGLTKLGGGTLVLAANNVYNGPTIVSNGLLVVNGTNSLSGTSGLTNYSGGGAFLLYGGTLGGTGMISGPVSIKNGATIAPGTSIGTLTLGSGLTLEAGSTNLLEVTNAPGNGDLIVVQGNLVSTNSTIALSVVGTPLAAGTYTLLQYSGTKTGSFNPTPVIVSGSIDGSYTIDESTAGQINLVVTHEVKITSQPSGTNVVEGQAFSVSVSEAGTAPLTNQWYFTTDTNVASTPIPGAGTNSYSIASAQTTNTGYYSVVVANNYNSVTSLFAFVNIATTPPVIAGPTNQTVIAGNNATLVTSLVSGAPAPTYQWYKGASPLSDDGVHFAGSATTTLTITNVQYPADQATYSVIASNVAGSATNSAVLTVIVTPVISPQPTNLSVNVGDTAVFTSGAAGVPTPTLQWYNNGGILSGQTGSTLTIPNAQGSDIATYTLMASNAAGVATSSGARLTVISTNLAITAMIPANGATGVCVDTPLYLSFNGAISSVNAGAVRIYNTNNPGTPVDTIDVSTNQVITNGVVGVYNVQPRTIGGAVYKTFPVLLITSNTAAIYPHSGVLATNQTYYVTMDAGVFADGNGAYFAGITNPATWQFATKAVGPAVGMTNVVVAADGSGDFCTVQGAADFVPANNTTPMLIDIRNGIYREIVFLNTKNNVTFRGQDRHQTIVSYVNNDPLNSGTAARPMFRVRGNDVAIVNMTLTNATPKGGLQAEALRVGDGSKRFIGFNCDFDSFQDTILINNSGDSAYFKDCHVQGDTDFIWGQGTMYFTNCELMCLSTQSHITQARTDATTNGIAFIRCQIIRGSAGVTNCDLGRDAGNGFPFSQVVYVNCSMDTHILPAGWIDGGLANKSSLRFWEYQSTDSTGTNLIDVSQRASWSQQINFNTATNVQDVFFWLYGWGPQVPSLPNNAPTLDPVSDRTINAGAILSITNHAADPDVPPQTLTFSQLSGPTNASIDGSTGVFTWHPLVSQANSTNLFAISVADNGSPVLSATQSFNVVVNPVTNPSLQSVSYGGGQFSFTVADGTIGPDYNVQASTNLVNWDTIFTTNSPLLPFTFDDTAGGYPTRFYRVRLTP